MAYDLELYRSIDLWNKSVTWHRYIDFDKLTKTTHDCRFDELRPRIRLSEQKLLICDVNYMVLVSIVLFLVIMIYLTNWIVRKL